jgi:hypothetical protein
MLSPRELYINSLLGGFDRLHEIRKARQRFGFVQGAMIQHKDMEGLCKGGSDTIHPDWEQRGCGGAGVRERSWRPWSVQRPRRERKSRRCAAPSQGLYPTGRDAPPDQRQEAQPGFVWGKHLDGADGRTARMLLGEERGQGGLTLRYHFGAFFACEGRERCGLAWRLSRTSTWPLE